MLQFQIVQNSVRIKVPDVVFQIQAVTLEHVISRAGPLANTQPATRGYLLLCFLVIPYLDKLREMSSL
jgi:hypothetical protein